jgi:hypothetical protein
MLANMTDRNNLGASRIPIRLGLHPDTDPGRGQRKRHSSIRGQRGRWGAIRGGSPQGQDIRPQAAGKLLRQSVVAGWQQTTILGP